MESLYRGFTVVGPLEELQDVVAGGRGVDGHGPGVKGQEGPHAGRRGRGVGALPRGGRRIAGVVQRGDLQLGSQPC